MSDWQPTDAIYALRAPKGKGEVRQHCLTRAAFLRHVIADSRTRDLFAWWGHSTGIDAVVETMRALLDAAAARAGLPHRSALRQQAHAVHLIPLLGVLQQHEARYEHLLAETQAERARFAIGWVVAELYGTVVDEEVPIRGWLASDLMTLFQWYVAGRVYGDRVRMIVPWSPTLDAAVPHAHRPKGDGQHLDQYATWYYRARVEMPNVTVPALAEEYLAEQEAAGKHLEPKDRGGFELRADTKTVRYGIGEAQRLLELPVPPEQWAFVYTNSGAIVGEKLVH